MLLALGMGWGTGDVAENCQQSPSVCKTPSPGGSSSMPSSLRKRSEPGTQAGLLGVNLWGWQQRRGNYWGGVFWSGAELWRPPAPPTPTIARPGERALVWVCV